MNKFEQDIRNNNSSIMENIFKSFDDHEQVEIVSKGLSLKDFSDQYAAGYEVYTKKNLSEFEKSVRDEMFDSTEDEISKAIDEAKEDLTPVIVRDDNDNKGVVYVKKV